MQLTIPERKRYKFERLDHIEYPQARLIAGRFQEIRRDLIDVLDDLELLTPRPKLNGARLKQIIVQVARDCNWVVSVRKTPTPHAFHTGDPTTRRCIACKRVLPLASFYAPVTPKQASYRHMLRDAEGFTDMYGRDVRGHSRVTRRPLPGRRGDVDGLPVYGKPRLLGKRMRVSMKCGECR